MNPKVKKMTMISPLIVCAFSHLDFVWKSRNSHFLATKWKNSKEMKLTHVLNSASPPLCSLYQRNQEVTRHREVMILIETHFSSPFCLECENITPSSSLPDFCHLCYSSWPVYGGGGESLSSGKDLTLQKWDTSSVGENWISEIRALDGRGPAPERRGLMFGRWALPMLSHLYLIGTREISHSKGELRVLYGECRSIFSFILFWRTTNPKARAQFREQYKAVYIAFGHKTSMWSPPIINLDWRLIEGDICYFLTVLVLTCLKISSKGVSATEWKFRGYKCILVSMKPTEIHCHKKPHLW